MDLSTNSYKFHENNINYFKKELGELNIIDVSKIIKERVKMVMIYYLTIN